MATVTGWTWDYIEDSLTLPRYYALADYWQEHPPTHLLVAAFMGYEATPKKPACGPDNPGSLADLISSFQAIGGIVG